jgi:AraC-like DNA-binding protein
MIFGTEERCHGLGMRMEAPKARPHKVVFEPRGARASFRRRRDLVGVEIRRVVLDHERASYCGYSPDFEFLRSETFNGEIWHRQRRVFARPDALMTAGPGELFHARAGKGSGALCSVVLDSEVFQGHLNEHDLDLTRLRLRPWTTMVGTLSASFARLVEQVERGTSLLAAQSSVAEFVASVVDELTDCSPSVQLGGDSDAAERVRDWLRSDTQATLDLSTLAREAGLSRFQILRAFKRRYGLPPQTYRLRVRVALAQKLLRSGERPAAVAAEFGFVDQSHLTRHFKRLVGITPAQYMRSGGCAPRLDAACGMGPHGASRGTGEAEA